MYGVALPVGQGVGPRIFITLVTRLVTAGVSHRNSFHSILPSYISEDYSNDCDGTSHSFNYGYYECNSLINTKRAGICSLSSHRVNDISCRLTLSVTASKRLDTKSAD